MDDKQKKYMIGEGWIVDVRGKSFIKFAGLLWLAHQSKIQEVKTEILAFDHENQFYIYKATIIGEKGKFEATGDANKTNTSKMIWPSMIRMAETRAIVRALRLYTGTGLTAFEELNGDDNQKTFIEKVKALPDTKLIEDKTPPKDKFSIRTYEPLLEFLNEFATHKNPIGLIMTHFAKTKTPTDIWTAKTTDYFIKQWKEGKRIPKGMI